MKFQLGFVCISFLFLAMFLTGLFNFIMKTEPNQCNMTFMYEYPQLVKVTLPSGTINDKKYGLYVYGEGRIIHKVREMKFDGVPVLFIPGNRGSPKQVRSLASVSLSKYQRSRIPFHFDYFAVDLNEDFSALYGGFLKEQTEFVNVCLQRILDLYREDDRPKSIIVIGHSMGGMIAKGLFLEPNFNPGVVELIITLATPHQPAILTDTLLASYYKSVNNFWDEYNSVENGVTLISIGGGPKDILVKSDLTQTGHASINVITPRIPGVWLSVDHLCILWCNQLVLVLVRSLFDSIHIGSKRLNTDLQLRKDVFSYHLLNRAGGKSYHSSKFPEEVELTPSSGDRWIDMNKKNMLWDEDKGVSKPTYIKIDLSSSYDTLAIETINHETKDWVFACFANPENVNVCRKGISLSAKARISLPLDKWKRKSAVINLLQLQQDQFTHIIIRTFPTKEPVKIYLDLFNKKERVVPGKTFLNFLNVVIPKTENNASYYSLELPDMSRFWHSYRLYVEPFDDCNLNIYGRGSVSVPWSNEGTSKLLKQGSSSLDFTLSTGRPIGNENVSVSANFYLDPRCSYKISAEKSLILTLASVVAHNGPSLIAHIACCLLFCIAYQAKCLGSDGNCPLIHTVLPLAAKPYFIIQASAFFGSVLQTLAKFFTFLPDTDIRVQAGFVELIVVPFFLHLAAFCATFIAATGIIVSVIVQGQAFNGLFLRFIKRYSLGLHWLSEFILNGMSKVPIVVSAFMVTVAYSASGGLALCVGLFFYFFKLITLYEDFWEGIVYWPLRYLKWTLKRRRGASVEDNPFPKFEVPTVSEISFHLSLILLWSVSTIISVPSVLVWAKNYKYNSRLEPDPFLYISIVMSVCAGFLWQSEFPKTELKWSRHLGYSLIVLGLGTMVYGQTNLYRIPYIVSAAFVLVTIHQMFVPLLMFVDDNQPAILSDASAPEVAGVEASSTGSSIEVNESNDAKAKKKTKLE